MVNEQSTHRGVRGSERLRNTWRPFLELRQRELGYRAGQAKQSHLHFQRRVGSSVNLVRRLERNVDYSYEAHSGCVNALNFNESGTGTRNVLGTIYDGKIHI